MEVPECFSSCWSRVRACFQKPAETEPRTRAAGKPNIVIQNVGATEEVKSKSVRKILPPLPNNKPGVYYVAQYDYAARTSEDLSFHTGDTLEALDKSNGDWWLARALSGVSINKRGYIPSNYVEPVESIHSES